jgi:PTH1 family peptidyl-tRNA hydrolase
LQDILRRLGTEEVPRLRIGIDEPPASRAAADWVLGRFTKHETEIIDVAIASAADAVVLWAREGIAAAMNRYN